MTSLRFRVTERRTAIKISQAELARRVGVTAQAVQSLESGRTKSFKKLVPLAEVLGVTPRWLVTGQGPKGLGDTPQATDLLAAMEDFAHRIREAREYLRLSSAAAARGIMAEEEWSRMEQAEYWPDPMQLDLLCGRLSQSLDWLVRGIVIASGERPLTRSEKHVFHEAPEAIRRARETRE